MEIVLVYQRRRREFGRQPLFRDRPAELTANFLPDPSLASNYVVKNPCYASASCCPDMSEHEVNTESISVTSQGVLHAEGGWPKDVDSSDVEHKLRYRKKVEKDEEYMRIVKNMCDSLEHYIKQNNALDIYEEYFSSKTNEEVSHIDPPSSRTLNVYRDPNTVKRPVNYVSWHPDGGKKVAVAYSDLHFQQASVGMTNESYIWDVEYPNAPDSKIIPPSPLVCLKYNPKDQHGLIGGMYNGLIAVWDVRKGPHPVDTSIIEKSHREAVFSVAWMSSKTGTEFFSTSTDGQVLWWDTRKLSEPMEGMHLDPEKNGTIVGGTSLDFEPTMPMKFMVGSEHGNIMMCNRKAKTPGERITSIFTGHHGPINALQRNPFFPRNFLSVGDWSAKIWSDDVKTPILTTRYHNTYLTDGCWSPTRPAVFCTGKTDGSVDFWDFIFKQNSPTLSVQVSNSPISCVKIQEQGKRVVVGAKDGTTTLLEVSESLSKLAPNEKNILSAMLEREVKREKLLEAMAREKRMKAQQKQPPKDTSKVDSPFIEVIRQAEEDFYKGNMSLKR